MDINQFDHMLKQQLADLKRKAPSLSQKVEADGLRFIDDNFRQQSWEGKPWAAIQRNGTILVQHGHLKNSFKGESHPGEVRIYSNMPYAKVHNEGFDGTQHVKSHTRSHYARAGRGKKKKTGSSRVKAFTRHMKIKQRQFAPTNSSPSPTLERQLNHTITDHFYEIIKPKTS